MIHDDDEGAIAAITVAELLVGVALSADAHRERRARFVEQTLHALPVEPYTLETARAHAELLAATHRSGRARRADLVIAATARATNRIVVTSDPVGFVDLPGVELRLTPAR